jgi:hypothetical protein
MGIGAYGRHCFIHQHCHGENYAGASLKAGHQMKKIRFWFNLVMSVCALCFLLTSGSIHRLNFAHSANVIFGYLSLAGAWFCGNVALSIFERWTRYLADRRQHRIERKSKRTAPVA